MNDLRSPLIRPAQSLTFTPKAEINAVLCHGLCPCECPARSDASLESRSIPSSGFLTSRSLVHEDSVAVQVFKHHSCAIGADIGLAVKFHAQTFHPFVLADAIVGV